MKKVLVFAKVHCLALAVFSAFMFTPLLVIAQVASPTPAASAAADGTQDFITMLSQDVQHFGGATAMAKVAMVIMLLIASTKVNLINSMIWQKVPSQLKPWMGVVLGALSGLASMYLGGQTVTSHDLLVWAMAGGGATVIHELLELVKAIPGVGPTYVAIISLVEGLLDQKKVTPPTA